MNLTRYQKALQYIHRAEIRYGSISKTPENDPDLIKARNLVAFGHRTVKTFEPDDLDFEIKKMLEYGYVDVVASDSHGITRRACHLEQCRAYIEKKLGQEIAERLLQENPAMIIHNEYR